MANWTTEIMCPKDAKLMATLENGNLCVHGNVTLDSGRLRCTDHNVECQVRGRPAQEQLPALA